MNKEINGYIVHVFDAEEQPEKLFYDIRYGFFYVKRLVLWTMKDDKAREIMQYGDHTLGLRYDEVTEELLAVWPE